MSKIHLITLLCNRVSRPMLFGYFKFFVVRLLLFPCYARLYFLYCNCCISSWLFCQSKGVTCKTREQDKRVCCNCWRGDDLLHPRPCQATICTHPIPWEKACKNRIQNYPILSLYSLLYVSLFSHCSFYSTFLILSVGPLNLTESREVYCFCQGQ